MSRFRRPEWVSYLLDLWDHYVRRLDRPEPMVCLGVWPAPATGLIDLTERVERAERAIARIRQMADAWEQRFPEAIRTDVAVEAIRTATERYSRDRP